MSLTCKMDNGAPVLFMTGRVTSTNAAEIEQAAREALADYSGKKLTIDLAELEYISSAGLRVLLRLRKQFAEMEPRKGKRRYYDNCLYFFCLLMLTGNYRIYM